MDNNRIYSAVIVVAVAVCYYKSLDCGFVFDDISAVVENKDLRPRVPLKNLFWNDFWGTPMHMERSHKSYRPLCVFTFRLNYYFSEMEPMSYHLINVVLHVVVCLLFMKVCNMFMKEFTSFLAALMFAVHPIHTEAVTGVVGRAEVLSSIFFLAALMTYSKSTAYHSTTKWPPLIGTVVLVSIAMLCKEQGITVIGVCCVYEVFIAQRATFSELLAIVMSFVKGKPFVPPWLKNSIVRAAFLVGTTLFLLFARVKVMGAQLPVFTRFDNPASMEPTPARQMTYNYLLPINLWLLLCPSGLCCDWTMGTIPVISSILDPRNIITISFYAGMFYFIKYMLEDQNKRNRTIVMSLTLMILPFIPASNLFFPVGFVVAERILYTPSMGFTMLVSLGLEILLENKKQLRPLLWGMLGLLLLTHSAKCFVRSKDWTSEHSLFVSALKINTKNAKLFNNVGHALEKVKKYDEALEYFEKAASVQPDDIGAHINVGRTYNNLNMSQEAETAYRRAMGLFPPVRPGKSYKARIAPNHLNVFLNLASLVSKNQSRLHEAEKLLRTAINMRPDYVKAYINRGDLLVKLGRHDEALKEYKTALMYENDNADVYFNIGVVSLELGKTRDARESFEQALHHEPDHEQSLYNSAIMIQEAGDPKFWPVSVERLNKLIKRDPKDPKYYFTLGMVQMDMKDFVAAEKSFRICVTHDPVFRSALFNLALLYTNYMNQHMAALPYLETLLKNYPDHIKGLMLMGDINVNTLKNLDAAEQNFLDVLKYDPKDVQANHNLCVVLVERGDLIKAEKCLTKVHEMAPKEEYIVRHLNIVRSKLNQAIKQRREEMEKQKKSQGQSPPGQNQQGQGQNSNGKPKP